MSYSNFHIMPTDNRSEFEGVAVFTEFFLIEASTGNGFPVKVSRSEETFYASKIELDEYNQEMVIGKLKSFSSEDNAHEYSKTLRPIEIRSEEWWESLTDDEKESFGKQYKRLYRTFTKLEIIDVFHNHLNKIT